MSATAEVHVETAASTSHAGTRMVSSKSERAAAAAAAGSAAAAAPRAASLRLIDKSAGAALGCRVHCGTSCVTEGVPIASMGNCGNPQVELWGTLFESPEPGSPAFPNPSAGCNSWIEPFRCTWLAASELGSLQVYIVRPDLYSSESCCPLPVSSGVVLVLPAEVLLTRFEAEVGAWFWVGADAARTRGRCEDVRNPVASPNLLRIPAAPPAQLLPAVPRGTRAWINKAEPGEKTRRSAAAPAG
eukprot:gene4966-biopygen13046